MPITRRLARHLTSATHNHSAAASSLPIELLSEIVQVGLAEYPPHDLHSIKYLNVVSSTCRAWRYAALGTSSLWRCITYEDKDSDPNPKRQTISHRTKERLSAYLSRSKGCSITLCLTFGKSSARIQRIKTIVYPHLTRCLSITLSFMWRGDIRNFFPLPGNLYQLTTFTCITRPVRCLMDGGIPPKIFTERGSVSLRKLIVGTYFLLDTINTQDLEEVYLTGYYGVWPKTIAFISRCRSLSTLVCDIRLDMEQPFTPVTLPTLTYVDTFYPSTLLAVRAPSLRTLILRGADDDDNLILLPSWPALTTFCLVDEDADSDTVESLLFSNAGIQRLIFVGCDGTAQLLGRDNPEGVVDTNGAMLLPSLGWLLICGYQAEHTARSLGPLLTRRPELRIEYDEEYLEVAHDHDKLKAAFKETGQNDEPGVFESHVFRPRVG